MSSQGTEKCVDNLVANAIHYDIVPFIGFSFMLVSTFDCRTHVPEASTMNPQIGKKPGVY